MNNFKASDAFTVVDEQKNGRCTVFAKRFPSVLVKITFTEQTATLRSVFKSDAKMVYEKQKRVPLADVAVWVLAMVMRALASQIDSNTSLSLYGKRARKVYNNMLLCELLRDLGLG